MIVEYDEGSGIACKRGHKFWKVNGKYHRIGGPAVIYVSGTKYWYRNGKPHRLDGPASEYPNGKNFWWLNGKQAIEIPNQEDIIIKKSIQIRNSFGIVLKQMDKNIYLILLGNKKIFVKTKSTK